MDWKETDERLIRRGELILAPSPILKNHRKELKTMNKHRRGRPYTTNKHKHTKTKCPRVPITYFKNIYL
jgi:hypothetical protein